MVLRLSGSQLFRWAQQLLGMVKTGCDDLFEPLSLTPPFMEVYQGEREAEPFLRVSHHPVLIMPTIGIGERVEVG